MAAAIIEQTPSTQFSILINDSDLQEIDLRETSKGTAIRGQTLVVHENFCYI